MLLSQLFTNLTNRARKVSTVCPAATASPAKKETAATPALEVHLAMPKRAAQAFRDFPALKATEAVTASPAPLAFRVAMVVRAMLASVSAALPASRAIRASAV